MRAHLKLSHTHKSWGLCRISTEDDLFIVMTVLMESGEMQLLLSTQEMGELERAIKKVKVAKRRMKSVS